jgi:hypothetical protein
MQKLNPKKDETPAVIKDKKVLKVSANNEKKTENETKKA